MLKIEIDKDRIEVLEASGDMLELVVELSMATGKIYEVFAERNKAVAEIFKKAVQRTMGDEAPTWDLNIPGVSFAVIKEKK